MNDFQIQAIPTPCLWDDGAGGLFFLATEAGEDLQTESSEEITTET